MQDIAVSVVIPTHNRRTELLRAIESVLAQDTPVTEIVVVDDASDESFSDLETIDERIRLVRHQTNRGGAASRNTGVAHASGNWIAFLDSDDTWLPHKLTTQLNMIGEGNRERLFLCCNVLSRRQGEADSWYNRRPPNVGEELSEYFLASGYSFQTSGLLVPTDVLKGVPFDGSLKRHQDWDLVLRLIGAGCHYRYCHEPLAVYWDAADSKRISRQRDPKPTLDWYAKAGDRLSPAAKAYFYSYFYFPPHLRQRPAEALSTLVSLNGQSPKALRYGLTGIAKQVASRLVAKGKF